MIDKADPPAANDPAEETPAAVFRARSDGVPPQILAAMVKAYPWLERLSWPKIAREFYSEKVARPITDIANFEWRIYAVRDLIDEDADKYRSYRPSKLAIGEEKFTTIILLEEDGRWPSTGEEHRTLRYLAEDPLVDIEKISWIVYINIRVSHYVVEVHLLRNSGQLQQWRTAAESTAEDLFGPFSDNED